jgi:hypothetical protein
MHGSASLVDYGAAQVHRPLTHNAVQTGDFAVVRHDLTQNNRGEGYRKDATRRTDAGLSFSVPNGENVAAKSASEAEIGRLKTLRDRAQGPVDPIFWFRPGFPSRLPLALSHSKDLVFFSRRFVVGLTYS